MKLQRPKKQKAPRQKAPRQTPQFLKNLSTKLKSLNKQQVFTIIATAFLILAHLMVILAVILSWRYYSIYPSVFGSVVAIVLLILMIIDIIFFVGFNHKDMALKVISTVLAIFLMIGGTVGTYLIGRTNAIVNNVLDDGKSGKYETYSGVFVCYNDYNHFSSLKELDGKRVGMLQETSNGLTYIATNLLSKEKIDYATVDFKTNAEMMQALLDGNVDAIVITSAYRSIYKGVEELDDEGNVTTVATEETPFAKYLDYLTDFYSFEEELKTDNNRTTKNISTEPFNVLLIGYSRTDIGSPVGLADSIIVATINPQSYEVSMTSIARDSFVPIACYGGELDKINSGRSTSKACFIETVENFLGMEMDYYMELDYLGLVQIVNTIGGIYINNPVEFTLDGIYVPAGEHVFADGQMALQFCRERHHMPNGDFDRQQHQKEVIIEIAKAFISSGDLTLALNAMNEASDWMSTDFTLSELTGMFNLLLNTKNFTSLDTFDLVDFQNSRITGYGGIMYYSYSMRLPLWVYLIYQGSYDDAKEHISNVMGTYKTINQTRNHEFALDNEYERVDKTNVEYAKSFIYEPEPMPPYWANLEGYSYSDAMAWASANGVSLGVNTIASGDPNYIASMEGLVVSQNPRYGSLISEYKSGSVTVMGPSKIDEDKQVPDFVEHGYSKAVSWAKEHGVRYDLDFDTDVSGKAGDVVKQTPSPGTPINKVDTLYLLVKAGVSTVNFDKNGHGRDSEVPNKIEVMTGDDRTYSFSSMSNVEENGTTWKFVGWYTDPNGGSRVYDTDDFSSGTVYAHWEDAGHEHTFTEDWKTVVQPTCTEPGKQTRTCSTCGQTLERGLDPLGHDFSVYVSGADPTCDTEGYATYKCSRCDQQNTTTIPVKTEGCSTEPVTPDPPVNPDPPQDNTNNPT